MKSIVSFFVFILLSGLISAQDQFSVPELNGDQKSEVLYSHVIAYAVTGISFARSQGVTAEEYGRFIGHKFKAYWQPEDGFAGLVNRIMYILAGLHPNNEMMIIRQSPKSVTFRLKNVDTSFQNGPMFDVSYRDYLECSFGIISVIAEHMGSKFSHRTDPDGWYEATFTEI
jgi:hypothetical protein